MTNDKPKHKMTRQEAVACFEKHMPMAKGASSIIDFYVEAGMLEIVEEKKSTIMLCNTDGQVSTFDLEYVKQIIKNNS